MKTKNNIHRLLSALLVFLLLFAVGCAPPPEVYEEEQVRRTDEPFNEDGTCYTQTVLLPQTVTVGTQNTPRYTLVGDTLMVTDAIPDTQTAFVWDLTTNLLTTQQLEPMVEIPDSSVFLRTHIPMQDGGTLQLLEVHTPQSEDPESPITTEMLLLCINADGTTRFSHSVDALFNDGYTHIVNLHRDAYTGYLYLSEPASQVLILNENGDVLDLLPWPEEETQSCALVEGEGGSIWMVERPYDIAEWRYTRYDADARAFVPAVTPLWTGYRLFPSDDNAWYEHIPEGFVFRTTDASDTLHEQILVNWVKSGFSDAQIRDLHLAATGNDTHLLFAVTQNYTTNEMSLTVFDPYRPYTAPERNELRLYADETWYTLQEAVVAFNAENVLYRVVYTDSPDDADLIFCGPNLPLGDTAVLDLYPYMDGDMFIRRQDLVPGALTAFEDDSGALQLMPVRVALSLHCDHDEQDKHDRMTSPTDYLCAVLTHDDGELDAAIPVIEPVLGLAIPTTAADPNAAWKFIRYLLLSENETTLYSGADEGFSVWQSLFDYQLSYVNGAYAAKHGNQFIFAYPNGADPETFDPMTSINFAAAANDGAHFVKFDRNQRAVLEEFFGIVTD